MSDITYRDPGPWGGGQGSNLTPTQVDTNFWILFSTLQQVQANIPLVEIAYFEVVGSTFYVVFTNHEVLGPYQLPQWEPNFVGEWQPNTPYNLNDSFYYNGLVYLVIFQGYPGAPTFNPFANDGLGHNYFSTPILGSPGNMLPNNGQPGQALIATTNQGVGNPPLVAWEYLYFDGLHDVALTSPLDVGDIPHWNGTHWTNVRPGSIISLEDLSDWALSSPLDAGAVLFWGGSDWTNGAIASLASGDLLKWSGTSWANHTPVPADYRFPANALPASTGTVSLDPTLGDVFTVTPTGAITLNAASAPAGAKITLVITTSGTSSYNVTPTTNFKSTGLLATGTASGKVFTMSWVGDGTNLNEVSRTTAM